MKNTLKALGIAWLLIAGSLAFAQSTQTVVEFPVEELGNCGSKAECKLYCDQAANREACFAFAQRVGLMSKEKVDAAKTILSKKGPGACTSRESCKAYCEDSAHQDECMAFAEKHKIIDSEKATFIKRVIRGEAPGACKSPETCRMYCSDPTHADECRAFAEDNSLMRKKMGSSTSERVKAIIASTSPGLDRAMELRKINSGNTTPPGKIGSSTKPVPPRAEPKNSTSTIKKTLPPPPPKTTPSNTEPAATDDLGAAVLKAFAKLLGF